MKDIMVSLSGTAVVTAFVIPYIVGWKVVQQAVITFIKSTLNQIAALVEDDINDY